jgi:hypothetical protein
LTNNKTLEIVGTWKQYSGWFLTENTGSWQESTGKIWTISDWNTACMFQRFPVSSCTIVRDPVTGIFDLDMIDYSN